MERKVKIAVLVSGGGSNLQSIIDHLESGFLDKAELVLVISSREDAYGLKRAEAYGVPGLCFSAKQWPDPQLRCQAMMAELRKVDAELIVLAGYMSILTPELIKAYEHRIINIHPSLIPKYCGKGFYGKRVHEAVLQGGERVSGATVHFVDEGIDTGKIILQEEVAVKPEDTPETLAARVLAVEHRILPEVIRLYSEGKLADK